MSDGSKPTPSPARPPAFVPAKADASKSPAPGRFLAKTMGSARGPSREEGPAARRTIVAPILVRGWRFRRAARINSRAGCAPFACWRFRGIHSQAGTGSLSGIGSPPGNEQRSRMRFPRVWMRRIWRRIWRARRGSISFRGGVAIRPREKRIARIAAKKQKSPLTLR